MSEQNRNTDNQAVETTIGLQYAPVQNADAARLYKLAKSFNIMHVTAIILIVAIIISVLLIWDSIAVTYSHATPTFPMPAWADKTVSTLINIIFIIGIPTAFISSIFVLYYMDVDPALIFVNCLTILILPCIAFVPPVILPCIFARIHLNKKGVKVGIFGVSSSKTRQLKGCMDQDTQQAEFIKGQPDIQQNVQIRQPEIPEAKTAPVILEYGNIHGVIYTSEEIRLIAFYTNALIFTSRLIFIPLALITPLKIFDAAIGLLKILTALETFLFIPCVIYCMLLCIGLNVRMPKQQSRSKTAALYILCFPLVILLTLRDSKKFLSKYKLTRNFWGYPVSSMQSE